MAWFIVAMVMIPVLKQMYDQKLAHDLEMEKLRVAQNAYDWRECDNYGVFSQKALDAVGGVYYTQAHQPQREVLVTAVADTLEWVQKDYMWSDKVVVGCVGTYIRPYLHKKD